MTNNPIALHGNDPVRSAVIDEVRAAMGRRRVSASALGRMSGTTQAYWSRRLTGMTAFDVDDFATLSRILRVPMAAFLPNEVPDSPQPDNGTAPPANVLKHGADDMETGYLRPVIDISTRIQRVS